jgi:hypothetical protein
MRCCSTVGVRSVTPDSHGTALSPIASRRRTASSWVRTCGRYLGDGGNRNRLSPYLRRTSPEMTPRARRTFRDCNLMSHSVRAGAVYVSECHHWRTCATRRPPRFPSRRARTSHSPSTKRPVRPAS